jgi:MoxR-like ATPase
MDRSLATARQTEVGRLLYEAKRVIVGQDHMLERILVGLLARGHLLVEGVPGLAKTLAIRTVAGAVQGEFKRIQFTPDLVPADLVGTRIYNQKNGEFQTSLGPVFTNLLLADEINRAPAKVQSALLEAMQERQVTIGRESHKLPDPFLVMATQNPIETEGTYALPEAQVDRFMMKVVIGYPNEMDEFLVVERMAQGLASVSPVMTTERLLQLQRETDRVFVDPVLMEYVVRLAAATRRPSEYGLPEIKKYITYGASPRASINLILTGRALAFMRGRTYVLAQDILDLVHDVLRHRLVLSYEALSDDVLPEQLIDRVLGKIPAPVQALEERVGARA